MNIGFLGLGVMGLPMAKNLIQKSGCVVYGYDVVNEQRDEVAAAGGHPVKEMNEVYPQCDVIMQMLPTHAIIIDSIERAIKYGKKGNIIIDLSSTAPHIIKKMYEQVKAAGMHLLDSPVSGAGIDLQTTFDATRAGFAGGPLYDNKVPKIIARDYEPGARIAVHRKDLINAKAYAHHLGVDLPVSDVTLRIMDWMADNGYIDIDQAGMIKYFESKMDVTVGNDL